jgi:serine protease Do
MATTSGATTSGRGLESSGVAGDLATVAERLRRSTVEVRVRHAGGAGSGVVWHPDGLVVTNAHVARADAATVETSDGRTLEARVVRRDPRRDLAALRVEADNLPVAAIADAGALRVGELVVALGHPYGVVGALSVGIVHAVGAGGAPGALGGLRWVQADVRLAPGNSGGPLADARGRVVGVNAMIVRGLALAVPSDEVERFLAAERRPALGVTLRPVVVARGAERRGGLLVLEVAAASAAEAGGLAIGDVILGVAGRPLTSPDDLTAALDATRSEVPLRIELLRGGRRLVRDVVLRGAAGSKAA